MYNGKKNSIVLINKFIRFSDNPLIDKAVNSSKYVYIVYILDKSIYGKSGSFKRLNEVKFISLGLRDLDNDIQVNTNSKLFLFVGKSLHTAIGNLLEHDPNIKTIYYDGGSSTDDLRLQLLIKRIQGIDSIAFNSEDLSKKTWRQTRSPFRIIEHRNYSIRLESAKTLKQFSERLELIKPSPETYNSNKFIKAQPIYGIYNINNLLSELTINHELKFGGRVQGLEILKKEKPVSFQTIYPFLRFGMISPHELINSDKFDIKDYARYIYTRRVYETKQLHYARIMDKKINRIYRESIASKDLAETDEHLRLLIRILRHRGIMSNNQFKEMVIELIKMRHITWAYINYLLRKYLIGYDVSINMIQIYSYIIPHSDIRNI